MKDTGIKRLYYSISEASRLADEEQYVLRYWETEFEQLRPQKNRAGNRVYTPKDIEIIKAIKHLLREKRYTIEGAKEIMKNYRFDTPLSALEDDVLPRLDSSAFSEHQQPLPQQSLAEAEESAQQLTQESALQPLSSQQTLAAPSNPTTQQPPHSHRIKTTSPSEQHTTAQHDSTHEEHLAVSATSASQQTSHAGTHSSYNTQHEDKGRSLQTISTALEHHAHQQTAFTLEELRQLRALLQRLLTLLS
jgi:DNA-binding transcriptional MerR regulator